jgi:hypothetical protein
MKKKRFQIEGRFRRAATLLCMAFAVSSALGQAQTTPESEPAAQPTERKVTRPRTSGPNTANLMPPTRRETRIRPIPNPVVRTNGFSMGLGSAYSNYPSCTAPYLMHTGGGHWIQYGYPFPLDLSWQNLQPGQLVEVPVPTWWRTQYEGYPLSETTRRVDPADKSQAVIVPAPTPVVAPPVDEGREALRAHEYGRAIAIYERRHEEQTSVEAGSPSGPLVDRTALRLLAVALVGSGRMEDGVAALSRALAEDASLARRPLDGLDLIGSRRELRRLVAQAVKFAKANSSPQSWELVASLMEAEGRFEVAAKMRKKGSDPPVKPAAPEKHAGGPASFKMPLPRAN